MSDTAWMAVLRSIYTDWGQGDSYLLLGPDRVRASSSTTCRRERRTAQAGSCWSAASRRRGSLGGHPPDQPDDLALDVHVPGQDRLQGRVLGLQPDVIGLAVVALDRGLVLNARHDDVAVARGGLTADDDEVAVVDARPDHAVAADADDERVGVAHKLRGQREIVLDVLLGQQWRARSDASHHR